MQKRTRSILDELDSLYIERDQRLMLENRANTLIENAIRLLDQIEETYSPDQAENLTRKLLNAIRQRDPAKFTRAARRSDANS